MARKKNNLLIQEEDYEQEQRMESNEVPDEPTPVVVPAPIVVKPVEAPAAPKKSLEPILGLEEIAHRISQYRAHHAPAIRAFALKKGYPMMGTEAEMKKILREFGYPI